MNSRNALRPAFAVLASIALVALTLAGCAAPLQIEAAADPLAILEPGALAYARMSGRVALELLPSALPPAAAKSLAPLLARTRLLAIGIGGTGALYAGAPLAPNLQACLIGDYPFRAASLSLGSEPGWKREKIGYFNSGLGLRAAVPGPNLVLASTGPLEPLLAAAKSPGASPIPRRLEALASRELALWLPDPFSRLAAAILGEAMDVPALGILIAASPRGKAPDADYDATVVFLMKDADSARIFRPALRLAWYAIARGLLGAEEGLGAVFVLDGDMYRASGIVLGSKDLARAIVFLRGS